jgi:hypothetical protein
MGSKRITVLILLIFSFCLKAKKSPFDVSSQSGSATTALVSGVRIPTIANGSNSTSTTTPTTNTPTTATIPAPPSNLVYTVTALQSKLIPGNTTVISPTITGTVSSWTISPSTLPPGVTFDTTTGVITCSPPVGSPAFPLTNFTVTAINPGGNTTFTVPLQVLGSGDNVWTVISGVSGQNVNVTQGSLTINRTTNSTSLYAAGFVQGSMDGETYVSPGFDSAFITKYDLNGNKAWTRMLGVAGAATNVPSLRIDSSENIFVTGSTAGTLDGQAFSGTRNLFMSKFNSAGTKQWTRLRGAGETNGNAISLDSSGNAYSLGYFFASALDSLTNTGWGQSAAQIVKYDTNGNWLGTNGVASTSGIFLVQGYASAISANGNIIMGGVSESSARCSISNGNRIPAIFIFNSSMTYTGCGSVTATSTGSFIFGLETDSSNNIYAVGYTDSNTFDGITKTSTAGTGNFDMFLIKFNSAGTRVWTRLYGAPGATNTRGMAITLSGSSLFLTGYTNGNLNGETLNGTQDMFIMKYDLQTDTVKWTKLFGSSGSATQGQGVTFDSNNTMYGVGTTTGDLSGTTNPTKPNASMFITRFVQ